MAYVIEKPIINDVQTPRWLGYGTGASHAFLVPEGKPLEATTGGGKVKAACGTHVVVSRLAAEGAKRCKKCVERFADRKVKANAGLSERTVDVVHTGAQQGAPREAEKKIAGEVLEISGDAEEVNAAIGDDLRKGRKGEALVKAKALDARGPAAPVPAGKSARQSKVSSTSPVTDPRHTGQRTADTRQRAVGQRGEARMDGVALTPGGVNVPPVQPMRRNKKTGALEVSSRGTMADKMSSDRPDRSIVGGRDKGRFTPTQRRNWRAKKHAQTVKAELAAAKLNGK